MIGEGGFIVPEGAMPTNVSLPTEHLCHYITDDQLRRLGEMRKDLVMEICLASGGILGGSLVPAFNGLKRFNRTPSGADGADLLAIMMFTAALVAFLITAYQWHVRQKSHVDLVKDIRDRPKVAVRQLSTES